MQISTISPQNPEFPDILTELHRPVKSINIIGEMPKPTDKLVAIVGTRKSTSYGRGVAYQLGNELAKAGVVVVSGLARGIDGLAHQGAIDAGGRTIAVLGHGLDRIYPAQHRQMAIDILDTAGALRSGYA
jgi:DNA processing protein